MWTIYLGNNLFYITRQVICKLTKILLEVTPMIPHGLKIMVYHRIKARKSFKIIVTRKQEQILKFSLKNTEKHQTDFSSYTKLISF